METLDGTEWDVVISGTGVVPSLLALALSRSGKRILHLDRDDYYGGNEAVLSLAEAETWAAKHCGEDVNATFSAATISRAEVEDAGAREKNKLSSSRAYSLALAPHLVYARSALLDALVSSRAHNQLDFQAIGSWFVVERSSFHLKLTRVPSGREDVFQDTSLDLKAKRALMKFLRFVGNYEDQPEIWQDFRDKPFSAFMGQKFALPAESHSMIMALTLSSESLGATTTHSALPRMARYLRSIGVLGPGFGAVMPKWGGLAEIAQVCCRACAVGGGVYVLNKAIKAIGTRNDGGPINLELADGEKVSTTWLCLNRGDLTTGVSGVDDEESQATLLSRSVSVVSSPLKSLFPPTSEGGVVPAGAVVVVPGTTIQEPPVHLFVHTADAGECPMTQSIIYGTTALAKDTGFAHLDRAVASLLDSIGEQPTPEVLWKLEYQQRTPIACESLKLENGVVSLPSLSQSLSLDDSVIDGVRSVYTEITGEAEESFMRFDARDGFEDEDALS